MQHVLHLLESRDYLPVAELSEAFAVSEVTVRSDLTTLAKQGLVARIRGGVRALQLGQSEVGFDLRLRLEVERKRAIARAAAAMVNRVRPSHSTRARPPTTSPSSFAPSGSW
jgi:DeoR/GlpR family transcriptional regulator of sugar metabolism